MASEMNKAELLELVEKLQNEIEVLKSSRKRGSSRKLELLVELAKGPGKVLDIANRMGTTSKNVSSLLCYLRKEGWGIIVNEQGEREITKFNDNPVDGEFINDYVSKERNIVGATE